ncbi:hypothetical protein SN811_08390 [Ligilactobacillus agilis]|uniref:Uncharacterized protein n=1 Tax=Ligilactobacillus agilis TaxID=1601 RepID=A0A6F9Y491_9LACO|nr:hypothetical protein [Ligilactobacillus agilis]GET12339.1 hypothetical protein SN811_08390 [Ligilactobacillus agilis]
MKNKSFAKKFLKAYIVCTVIILNFVSISSFFILLSDHNWWCVVALFFIPVTVGMLVATIGDWFTGCDD